MRELYYLVLKIRPLPTPPNFCSTVAAKKVG